MKTTIAILTAIFSMISAWADISITSTNQQPPSLLVRKGITPMLRFVVKGSYSSIESFVIQASDLLSNTSIGKVSIDAQYQSFAPFTISTTPVDFSGTFDQLRIPVQMSFTGEKTYVITVKLEMNSDLSLNAGESLRFLLVSVDTQQVVSGILPVYGEFQTINNTLTIGSIAVSSAGQDQNLTIGSANQVIGAVAVDVGSVEPMVSELSPFYIETPGQNSGLVRNVVLVDNQNSVVAGPVDVHAGEDWSLGTITFNDTVTFPKGGGQYYLKANLGAGMKANGLLRVYTNPSDWSARGQLYGYATKVRPIGETVFGPTMTLKGPALRISLDPNRNGQTVVGGRNGFTSASVYLDGRQSSEDIRINGLSLDLAISNFPPTGISNCGFYNADGDGITPIVTDINLVNPQQAGIQVFNFDTGFIVPAGTLKILHLRINTASGQPEGSFTWRLLGTNNLTRSVGTLSGNMASVTEMTGATTTTYFPKSGAKMKRLEFVPRTDVQGWKTANITFQGDCRLIYTVKESTDLIHWQPVTALESSWTPDENGSFMVVTYPMPGEDHKFFQAVGQ